MKRRPWQLILLAVFHIIAPLGNGVINAWLVGLPFMTYMSIKFQTQPVWDSIMFLVLPPIAGIAIYICKRWSFWVYLASMIGMLVSSFMHWDNNSTLNTVFFALVTLSDLIIVGYFFLPDVKKIYFDPKLRWWENKPRYIAGFKGDYNLNGNKTTCEIINISESGLFLKSENLPSDNSVFNIHFTFDGIDCDLEGQAIHHKRQKDIGIGVKFTTQNGSLKNLKQVIQILKSQGKLIESLALTEEDSLRFWVKNLLKGQESIVPKVKKKS